LIILVTGCAGFIGFHVAQRLLKDGHSVFGIDDLNNYYDPKLKNDRLNYLLNSPNFNFHQIKIQDKNFLQFFDHKFDKVIHLAAQPGVRYSIENPKAYIDSNLEGFVNVLEGCKINKTPLIYASSSSVYGTNTKVPFSVSDSTDSPASLYAATKKANELMACSYSHLFQISVTGLRFFTVYGPWGRPDMALFKFTKAIIEGKPIDVYNNGDMKRDYTYIDDVVEGIIRINDLTSKPNKIYNIGNTDPVSLGKFISTIEIALGKKAIYNYLPMQPGDVLETFADMSETEKDIGKLPATSIEIGIPKFVEWYKSYFGSG
jgi:UDP-glucuronate 4-epimerase